MIIACILFFFFSAQAAWCAAGLAGRIAYFISLNRRFLPGAISGFVFFTMTAALLRDVLFAAAAFAAGIFVPSALMRYGEKREKEKFERQLSDALFVISSSVKSGTNLAQALENAAGESNPPFSEALSGALSQTRVGVSLKEALLEMDKKMNIRDLHLAIAAINAAQEYGGSLSENLSRIAATIRQRKKLKDKMNAATAQGRLSALTITAIPFLLAGALGFMEPSIFGVLTTSLYGKLILAAASLMAFAGNYVIMKIVRIKQ